jgi:hypothetical protein
MYRLFFPPSLTAVLFTLFTQCANPVDDPPLKWETNASVPISNKAFYLKKELDNLFTWDSIKVIDNRPEDKDSLDTLVLSIERFTSNLFETTEDSLKDNRYRNVLGPLSLGNAKLIQLSSPLPAASGAFSVPLTLTLDSIYNITFYDTITNTLTIAVTNNSTTQLSTVVISSATLGSDTITSIAPNSTENAILPIYGKKAGHTVALTMSGIKGAGSGTVTMKINLNNITASSVKAQDYLLQFKREFTSEYEVTDTVAIDYVDLADGFFFYEFQNSTDIPLSVHREHLHLWIASYCQRTGRNSIESLSSTSHADSVEAYYGSASNSSILVQPNTELQLERSNLSKTRLFTIWNPDIKKTVSRVRYSIETTPAHGEILELNASDSIIFTIRSKSFKFEEFLGTSMEPYSRFSDTQKIFLDIPWNRSSLDSLRGRFFLQNVTGNIVATPVMLDSLSYIDTMNVKFVVFSPESLSVKDSTLTTFNHVCNDSVYHRSINITDVTNLFPDTIYVAAKIVVPKGTKMKVRNDLSPSDPDYSKYIGRMRIRLNNNYFLNSDLDWKVTDTVNMDLGSGTFEVPQELRYVRKLENKKGWFNALIANHSNLNMYLYALLAPHSRMAALDSIDANRFTYLINHPDSARALGFVHFLGTKGVYLPKRDSVYANEVFWDNNALDSIVMSDSCKWRWQLRFVPGGRDALRDVDYLMINSALRVDGINNMDSLFIW